MTKRTKIALILFLAFVLGSILHNMASAIFKVEEPFFFFISVGSFLGFLIYLIYGTIYRIIKGKPKDWWKVAYVGLFGLIGFVPQFGANFFGFYGLFALFGLKK